MPSTNSLKQKAPKRVCMVQRSGPRDLQFRAISRALCSHSGKQETAPSAFWEEAKHLQNYGCVAESMGENSYCCEQMDFFPPPTILSERSSPSRVRFAAPKNRRALDGSGPL